MSIKALLKKLLEKRISDRQRTPVIFPGGIFPINEFCENDVFIVGFPKSGNTLMQHIVAHLFYGINERSGRTLVNLIVPDVYANSHYFRMNNRCFFKSHDLPKPEHKKVIYIIRDGRDALVSYYHMLHNMGQTISMTDLFDGTHKIFNTTWGEHLRAWEENPYEAEILWLKYEDLLIDKSTQIKRIVDFLGLKVSEEEITNVVELTTFDHMKKLEGRDDWGRMKRGRFLDKKSFIRKGKAKIYLDEVNRESLERFESLNGEMLNKYYQS